MSYFASIIGRFIGAILAECAPTIIKIIRESRRNEVQDSNAPSHLIERLNEQLSNSTD